MIADASRKAGSMSRRETLVKCVLWYIGASALAPLPCLLLGSLGLSFAKLCVVGLPAMLGLVLLPWVNLEPIPIVVIGHVVQIGLLVAAISVRDQAIRQKIYRVFLGLLLTDVVVALLFPFLFLMARGLGE
jgi:hypothetical protein